MSGTNRIYQFFEYKFLPGEQPNESNLPKWVKINKLLHEIENSQVTYEKVLQRIENICSDINKLISMQSLNLNQINVLNTLFMVNQIFTGKTEC